MSWRKRSGSLLLTDSDTKQTLGRAPSTHVDRSNFETVLLRLPQISKPNLTSVEDKRNAKLQLRSGFYVFRLVAFRRIGKLEVNELTLSE